MERLGDIVARVLANVRATMDGERAGEHEAPRQVARTGGGDQASALARGDRLSPRATVRRGCRPTVGAAGRSLER